MAPSHRPWTLLVLGAAALAVVAVAERPSSQGRSNARRNITVNGHEAVDGEVLVRFKRALAPAERAQLESQVDAEENEALAPNVRRLKSRSYDVNALVNYLRTRPDVEFAEPNYIQYALDTHTPSDASFGSLWGLLNTGQTVNSDPGTPGKDIHAAAAWDISTGSQANVVAVIDTGIDYNHPDLAANVWTAPFAFSVNVNGTTINCAAGTHGFNAIANTCNPMDDHDHGTHVAGTIGAVANNPATGGKNIVGVNWTASLIGAKFLSATGSGSTANAIKAIEFLIQAKQVAGLGANVRVLSNSWGGGGYSQALLDEINKANNADMLFVAAAGNSATNTDASSSYPASYDAPNVIAVAATDNDDALASFSNYGLTSVDLAAPGVNIHSTIRNSGYAYYNGTSMATPHVSGAAALVLSACAMTTSQLKDTILFNVESVGGLATRVATGGRLDVNAAIRSCTPPPSSRPASPTILSAVAGNTQVALAWSVPAGAATFNVLRGTAANVYDLAPVASGLTTSTYTDLGLTNGVTYHYAVVALNSVGSSAPSADQAATPNAPPQAPTNLAATAGPSGTRRITVSWTSSTGATSYRVKRSTSSSRPYTIIATPTGTSLTNTGLRKNQRYYYLVAAVNALGASPDAGPVSAVAK